MKAFRSPRTWTPRRWLFQIHLIAGIAAGALALVVGLSGAALVYAPDWETPPRPATAAPLPLDRLAAASLAAVPGARLRDIRFDEAGNATHFHVQPPPPAGREGRETPGLHLSLHPATGAVTATLDRHTGFWHWLRELHHNLLAGKTGRLVNGIGAGLLLLLALTGAVLWWPGPALWRKRLTIQPGTGWKRTNWDTHNAVGFWLLLPIAFFSFTGLRFAFPQTIVAAVRALTLSPGKPPKKPRIADAAPTASLEALLASARSAVPGATVTQLKLSHKKGEPVEARLRTPFDGHRDGNSRVFLHPADARVLELRLFSTLPFGEKLLALLDPLHMARFAPPGPLTTALRAFWVLAGLAPGLLFLTGFFMWWNRSLRKRLAVLQTSAPARQSRAAVATLCLLAFTTLSPAQTTDPTSGPTPNSAARLSGTVLDGDSAPVPDALVTLLTSPERTFRTTSDGAFDFPRISPGAYSLRIQAAGFTPYLAQVRTGTPLQAVLVPAPLIAVIEVNAGSFDQIRLEEPVFQTGLNRSDIATRNNRRLSDIVARMPGVFMSGPPGGDKDVRLRGMDKEFTRTQVDGAIIPDGGEKRELQLNRIPSATVESVRIIRNPTAEFESDGLAGRVDVQTRPIPEQLHLDARAAYGARDGILDNRIAQGQFSGGARFHRHLGFFGTFDYLDDTLPISRAKLFANRDLESERERQRQSSPNFFGNLGVYTDRFGDLHIKPVVMNFHTGMSKLRETTNGAGRLTKREDEFEDKDQQTLGGTLNHRYARSSGLILDTQAGWFLSSEGKDKSKLAYKVAGDGSFAPDKRTLEPESKADRTWMASSSAALPVRALFWQDLKFGASLRWRNRHRDKSRFEIGPTGAIKFTGEDKDRYRLSEDYSAGFIQDQIRLTDRLLFTPGVRYERVVLNTASGPDAAAPRSFHDINPSAHLLFRVTSAMSLRAAASRGLARPKFDELAPYENVTTTKIVIGNPDLNPTRAWNYDLGFDYATRLATFSVNGFRKTIRGVIEEVDTGADRDGRDVFQVMNVGNGWTRGLEFEQRLRMPSAAPRWARLFSFWANQTLLSSNLRAFNGQQRPLKEQPRWIANLGSDFSDEKFGSTLSVMCNFVSRRYDYKTNGDVTSLGGSTSLDIAYYQRLHGNWRIFLEGNNLTGRGRVQDEIFLNGTLNRRTELFGRTMLFGIQVGF